MEQFNTIPTSGNWADIAGILDANFLRCWTALVQSQSLIGLDGSNYKGMYTSASALPDDMTEAGWALVGSSLSALQLYVFNDGATDWALFSNETYNFTSWTEFQTQLDALSTQVATIGLKLGMLNVSSAIINDGWTFNQGSFNTSGAWVGGNTRIRINKGVSTGCGVISAPDGYLIHVVYYYNYWNSNTDFQLATPYSSIGKQTFTPDTTYPVFCFSIRKPDNTSITPDEVLAFYDYGILSRIEDLKDTDALINTKVTNLENIAIQEGGKFQNSWVGSTSGAHSPSTDRLNVSVKSGDTIKITLTGTSGTARFYNNKSETAFQTQWLVDGTETSVVASDDILQIGVYHEALATETTISLSVISGMIPELISETVNGIVEPLAERVGEIETEVGFSSNREANQYIKEVYADTLPSAFSPTRLSFEVARPYNDKFRNLVRIGSAGIANGYFDVYIATFSTEEAALADAQSLSFVQSGAYMALVDFSSVTAGLGKTFSNVTFKDVSNIANAPRLQSYIMRLRERFPFSEMSVNRYLVEFYYPQELPTLSSFRLRRGYGSNLQSNCYFVTPNGDLIIFNSKNYGTQDTLLAIEPYVVKFTYNGVNGYAVINWQAAPIGSNISFAGPFTPVNTKKLDKCPYIYAFMREDMLQQENSQHFDELAAEAADGERQIFTIANPFVDGTLQVFADGKKLFAGAGYTLNAKQRYVELDTPPSSEVGYNYLYKSHIRKGELKLSDNVATPDSMTYVASQVLGLNINDTTNQWIENIADPTNQSVMVYATNSRSTDVYTRVQSGLVPLRDEWGDSIEAEVSLYLPSASLQCLESYPNKIGWLTIQETWGPYGDVTGTTTTTKPGCRQTLGLLKKAGNNHLYFDLLCQDRTMKPDGTELYTEVAHLSDLDTESFPIPFDKWITLKTYVKSGSAGNGHYKLVVVVDGVTTTIFDADIPTMPTILIGGNYPQALASGFDSNTCFIKMYTSEHYTRYVVENSELGYMQMLWKDFSYSIKSPEE